MVTIATKVVRCKVRADVYWDRITNQCRNANYVLNVPSLTTLRVKTVLFLSLTDEEIHFDKSAPFPRKGSGNLSIWFPTLNQLDIKWSLYKNLGKSKNIRKYAFWLLEQYPAFNRKFKWHKEGSCTASQNFSVLQPSSLCNGLYGGIISNKLFIVKRIINYFFLEIVF